MARSGAGFEPLVQRSVPLRTVATPLTASGGASWPRGSSSTPDNPWFTTWSSPTAERRRRTSSRCRLRGTGGWARGFISRRLNRAAALASGRAAARELDHTELFEDRLSLGFDPVCRLARQTPQTCERTERQRDLESVLMIPKFSSSSRALLKALIERINCSVKVSGLHVCPPSGPVELRHDRPKRPKSSPRGGAPLLFARAPRRFLPRVRGTR